MKRLSIFLASMIITMLVIFVFSVSAAEKYKSMAELYPEQTKSQGLIGLGETVLESDGNQYRVMAECKHLINDIWLQFMDTTDPNYGSGEIDNVVDFVIKFQLIDDEFYRITTYCFEDIMPQLYKYCKENNMEIKDWVHFAKPFVTPRISVPKITA